MDFACFTIRIVEESRDQFIAFIIHVHLTNVLSRVSEAGSPTNRPGSDKTQGQGSFGTNRTFDLPFLPRQGEPGTSQYIVSISCK